jgi:hypothetical protein
MTFCGPVSDPWERPTVISGLGVLRPVESMEELEKSLTEGAGLGDSENGASNGNAQMSGVGGVGCSRSVKLKISPRESLEGLRPKFHAMIALISNWTQMQKLLPAVLCSTDDFRPNSA